MADGRSVMLTEVRHVPNLRKKFDFYWNARCKGMQREEWTREATVAQRYAKQAQGYLKDPEWYKSAGRCFGICTEVWPDTSGATSAGCPWRSSEEGDQVVFEKLYNEGRGDAEASLFCSRFDQWRCSLQLCAQGKRDGATTTRKVTYFAAHPGRGCGAPQWGGAGHLGEKVQALRYGGAYTSVGSGVAL
ncbi:hypothetical protein Acr_11g0005540 [Actinidia rufa]|uniref:Uncharacterized protein n=1 Tax=Actinidia rufa TaxID=165716 RepID=A0A7J0FC59_9ERIC|nr:hypothetical protein Acr_11g0005540 [Actinidia rufa]